MNVIVADDERIVRQGIRMTCEQSGFGLTVWEARNGKEAFELVREHQADILILDIRMPQMNGLEVLEALQGCGTSPVCIVISGYDDFSYARAAIRYGVLDYLLKPAGVTEITDALKRSLEQLERERIVHTTDAENGPPSLPGPLLMAQEYIQHHLQERISLVAAADFAHVSPTHLAMLFRQKTGETFLSYVTSRKMEIACQLLKRGFLIHEIADHLGYGDARYFGQVFKKTTGVRPSEYRTRCDGTCGASG